MIIECENCASKFNLNETLLKAGGSRVRCSVCKHVFFAHPIREVPFEKPATNEFLGEEAFPLDSSAAFGEEEMKETTQIHEFPLQTYLTWREILSGGVKISKSLNKELSLSREYIFSDKEEEKDYTVFYFPSSAFFLGLKEFFENNNVPQGARLTLERTGPTQFNFLLKKSKKKLPVLKIDYDPKEDKFAASGEEVFTFSLPNKIIHLKRETLVELFALYPQIDGLNLQELLILIYKNFGLETHNFALHYLRAYHLVDILKQTTQEEVEKTLLNSPEFSASEKNKGIFFCWSWI